MNFGRSKCTRSALRRVVLAMLCAGLFIQQTHAQQLLWHRVFDTGKQDYCADMAVDCHGNIVVVGTTIPEKVQPPNHDDFLIVKYNSSGDTLWTKRYNLTVADDAYGVTTDHADNIFVVGCIFNDSTNADIHIVKYDPDGNILWTRTYSNGERDIGEFGYGVVIDSRNNIVVVGTAYYNLGDYITLKYDSSGNLLWIRSYNGGWEDYAQDVAVDDSDNVIVTGYSDSGINWDWCTIKYTPDGNALWIKRYDATIDDWAHGVSVDKEENIIVVGEIRPVYKSCGAIVKYNPQGDTLWTKFFTDALQPTNVGSFADVTTDDRDNIYLVGNYAGLYIAKCNSSGDTLWTFRYNEGEASGIALDGLGNIIVAGTTNQNYLTIKIKDLVNLVDDELFVPRKFILYPNYPNPFNPRTAISYQLATSSYVTLKVYDVLGREVRTLVDQRKPPGMYSIKWDASRYASGMYIARLTAGNYVASQKLLLMK
jgi:uncharacterized delta-60 repeat protein